MDMYSGIDFQSEFRKYAIKHLGVSGAQFYSWEKVQSSLYDNVNIIHPSQIPKIVDYSKGIANSQMPYIIEEREMRVTQMDIFSRLMMDRILYLSGPVNDQMSTIVSSQLLFLDNVDSNSDITMYIDGPGGSVKSGLTIVDTMDLISSDVRTINTGMAASMSSVLLGAGTKGKRSALRHSRVMLHQVSSGMEGNIQDIEISMRQSKLYNEELLELLGEYCGKDPKQILEDTRRDLWLTAKEAVEYGIIDSVLLKK